MPIREIFPHANILVQGVGVVVDIQVESGAQIFYGTRWYPTEFRHPDSDLHQSRETDIGCR